MSAPLVLADHVSELSPEAVAALLHHGQDWHDARQGGIGGSEIGRVLAGGEDAYHLWRIKTGRAAPDNLADKLYVQMGTWTEPLNRYWFQQRTGLTVSVRRLSRTHPKHRFLRASLDGWVGLSPWQAKHTGGYDFQAKAKRTIDTEIVRHYAQLQHEMLVTGAPSAYLSVFFDHGAFDWAEVPADPETQALIVAHAARFWAHVESATPPEGVAAAEVPAPPVAAARLDVDMTGDNAWAAAAATLRETADAAKRFEAAKKDLKAKTPADAKQARGHGAIVARTKNGRLLPRVDPDFVADPQTETA